jgi:ABC-type nitrate/sulfonate/bicarbonate transport system substrate-binding protein
VPVCAQTKTIVVGEGVRGAKCLPAYVAEEKGFFQKRELDTRLVTFSRSNHTSTRWFPAIASSISPRRTR